MKELKRSASQPALRPYTSLSHTRLPVSATITTLHPLATRHQASYGTTTGRLDLNGRPFEPWALTHMIGFVPQAYILFDELTVCAAAGSKCPGSQQLIKYGNHPLSISPFRLLKDALLGHKKSPYNGCQIFRWV